MESKCQLCGRKILMYFDPSDDKDPHWIHAEEVCCHDIVPIKQPVMTDIEGKPTKEHYEYAILMLKLGMTQLEPDGRNCIICGDGDHQAWECHHNPLNPRYIWREAWRCFHCNAVFTNSEAASEHFGEREQPLPQCKLRCSGYGVFPNGNKCKGCEDCNDDPDQFWNCSCGTYNKGWGLCDTCHTPRP